MRRGAGWVLSRSANSQPSQRIAPRRRLLARTYRQLDLDQRRTLFRLVEARTPVGEIAARLGRHPSTIDRELGRNRFRDGDRGFCGYFLLNAQDLARRRRQRRRKLAADPALRAHVTERLGAGWSPQQIAGRLKQEQADEGASVCHETIYRHVYGPEGQRDGLYRTCPRRAAGAGPATAEGRAAPPSRASAGSKTVRRRSRAGRASGTGRPTC